MKDVFVQDLNRLMQAGVELSRRIVNLVPCDSCKAERRASCMTMSGNETAPHQARIRSYAGIKRAEGR